MNQTPVYSAYQSRWYRPRVSAYWWLGQWAYLKFILREFSSIFVAYFVVLILLQLWALRDGPEAYAAWALCCSTPLPGSIWHRARWSCAWGASVCPIR
jgi:fumarate reductase subunit C